MPPEKAAAEVTAEPPAAPKGVVCILIDPKGRVWAEASDFIPGWREELERREGVKLITERRFGQEHLVPRAA